MGIRNKKLLNRKLEMQGSYKKRSEVKVNCRK